MTRLYSAMNALIPFEKRGLVRFFVALESLAGLIF